VINDLLQTKLFIPRLRPSLVPRHRLIEQLNQGKQGKLTLVSAPAGFGKTTLVVAWLEEKRRSEGAGEQRSRGKNSNYQSPISDISACWLSLDENDNSLSRFFTYLIAAVQTVAPKFGSSLLSSLQSAQPQNETAVTQTLINELAQASHPLTLILDDYHVITNTAVHQTLATLIDHLPPHIHLIITSREDPPLPLPRWRVRGQLTEIRADDLRFNTEEAADFLRQTMGLQLDEQDIASLENRTEGWAAGLQLAAISLRDQSDPTAVIETFSGSDRYVADYLLAEVLYRQSEEIQHFLLQTAVLERMCAPLCEALVAGGEWRVASGEWRVESGDSLVTGHSQTILEHLESTNLFLVPLDNQRRWYRYHHLFAQLLRERLRREGGETAVRQLHQRAAGWYESQNLPEEAIYHAFQAGDFENAGRLVAGTTVDSLWQQGGASLVQQWARALPAPIIKLYPRIAILAAAAHLIVGEVQTAARYLEMAAGQPEVEAEWHLLEAVLMRNRGQIAEALEYAQYAFDSLASDQHNLRTFAQLQLIGNFLELAELDEAEQAIDTIRRNFDQIDIASRLQVLRMHGVIATLRADLHRAANIYQEGTRLTEATGQPMIGTLYNGLGFLHFQWHEMDKAAAYYEQAINWAERTGITDILFDGLIGQAELACWRGEPQIALDIMAQFQQFAQRSRLSEIIEISDMLNASFHLKAGQLETAVRWANALGLTVHDKPTFRLHSHYKLFIAIRISQSRHSGEKSQLPALSQLAERLLNLLRRLNYNFDVIELLTWKTILHEQQGNEARAIECLQTAVDLAYKGSIIYPFVDKGTAIQALLPQLTGTHSHYVHSLLNAFPSHLSSLLSPLLDPLTEREQEVLNCIVAGLSNKAIQEKLFISKNTVRSHIKNLYSKLNVSSRTQAIARARELELL
jgi:LuxR family maltose regulon positive regulatory protein